MTAHPTAELYCLHAAIAMPASTTGNVGRHASYSQSLQDIWTGKSVLSGQQLAEQTLCNSGTRTASAVFSPDDAGWCHHKGAAYAACKAVVQWASSRLSWPKPDDACWPLQIVQEANSKAQHVTLHAGPRINEDGSSSGDEEQEEPAERHAECSFARDFRTCVESAGGECSGIEHVGCNRELTLRAAHLVCCSALAACTQHAFHRDTQLQGALQVPRNRTWQQPALSDAVLPSQHAAKPSRCTRPTCTPSPLALRCLCRP